VLENLTTAFARATSNITACKSQLAGARAQLEAEYHSFYDDELTPFLKGVADAAHASARTEFGSVEELPKRARHAPPPEEDDAPEDDDLELEERTRTPLFSKRLSFRRGAR
jgi:hypothetical protein